MNRKPDWLAREITLNAIDKILEERETNKLTDRLILVKRDSDGKYNYIRDDGIPLLNEWYDRIYPFSEGFARVVIKETFVDKETWETITRERVNFIDANGNFISKKWFNSARDFHDGVAIVNGANILKPNGEVLLKDNEQYIHNFNSGRAMVEDDREWYHYIDKEGNQVGDARFSIHHIFDYFTPDVINKFIDGYAIASFGPHEKYVLINTDCKALPEAKGDEAVPYGYCGYGYYFAGQIDKMNGVKLKDANNGIVIDTYHRISGFEMSTSRPLRVIKRTINQVTSKELPSLDYTEENLAVTKENGILYINNYWFLGPSNISIVKEGLMYRVYGPFNTFVTKIPPIRVLDSHYALCAHDEKMYLYDIENKDYTRTCDRKDVEEHVRKRIERKKLVKLAEAMKALRYLNMRGTSAKLSIEFKDDFIRKTIYNDPIANFEIDPAYLEIPGVLQYLYVNDYSDRTISYNGKRTSTDNVLNELLERDREIDMDTAVENISPKSYL